MFKKKTHLDINPLQHFLIPGTLSLESLGYYFKKQLKTHLFWKQLIH